MTITNHGHHIPGTTRDDEPDEIQVYRCGGVQLCWRCRDDARQAVPVSAITSPEPEPSTPAEKLLYNLQFDLEKAVRGSKTMTYGEIHRKLQDIIRIL